MPPQPPPHPPPPRGSESRPGELRRPPGRTLAPPVRSADADRPSPPPEGFYDGLAAVYHLIYPDWPLARRHQGEVFAALLAGQGIAPGAAVLDCAAGIGTQALGLAAAGYRVTATDVSAAALQRLAAEARALNLPVMEVGGHRLIRRLTLITRDAVVQQVFYPVFPPDRNAGDVLDWLHRR